MSEHLAAYLRKIETARRLGNDTEHTHRPALHALLEALNESIAVTNEPKLSLEEIRVAIRARGLNNLAMPREVKYLNELPRLGTGKVNHRELARLV